MLYPTHHHPLFFSFNPFPSSISSSHPPPSPTPLASLSSSQEMECVEGALKSSLMPEMAAKTTHQTLSEDFSAVSGQNGVSGDDFFVDNLLDFSKAATGDGFVEEQEEEEEEEEEKKMNNGKVCSFSVSVSDIQQILAEDDKNCNPNEKTGFSKDEFGSVAGSELSVPADDLANLEWLSHFVEDSFSEYSLAYPAGKFALKPAENCPEQGKPVQTKLCFTTPVQTKARSKRARTGGRIWSLGSPSLTESSTSSSSSSSSATLSSPPSGWLIYATPGGGHTAESFLGRPPMKKPKQRKLPSETPGVGAPQPRRCSHCGVQKTPQWRAGPLGAKTLCNACGVRFKSGRLLPEYRPACSPTFSSQLHSNNHRKVLEMRRKKEVEAGPVQPVQSF